MVHLTNNNTVGYMVLFSFLTYFLGPVITRPF